MAQKKVKHLEQAQIIAVFNQKGGCAKTQTAMQLAGTLGRDGWRVMVVDMDAQGTSLMWSGQASEAAPFPATVVSLAKLGKNMVSEVKKFSSVYDFIIIDCPPAIESPIPWAALLIANLGLMPVVPLAESLWASREAINLGKRAQEENPSLELRMLASNVGRGKLFQVGMEALRETAEAEGIKLLDSQLSSRNAFPTSAMVGTTAHGLASKSPAIDEVEAMVTNTLKVLKIKR